MKSPAIVISLVASIWMTGASAGAGDATNGAEIYQRCIACHSLERNRTGPKHCGLFGRRAGSLEGYAFSPAMRNSGIVWDEKSLDWFLLNPLKAVPGTKMGYAGVKNSKERSDLIAHLKAASQNPEICPQ